MNDLLIKHKTRILQIANRHGAFNIKIFGSFARGEENENSDIDLLIKLQPGRSLLDLIAIKQDIEDLLGCKVDVVTDAAISPYIREPVMNEAVNL